MSRHRKQLIGHVESLESRACPAVVSISGPETLQEQGGPITLTARLSEAQRRPVEVGYLLGGAARLGTDFRVSIGNQSLSPSGAFTFRPGETSVAISVRPINDTIREGTESLSLSLLSARGHTLGSRAAQVLILDDDNYTAAIDGKSQISPGDRGTFTVRLSSPATRTETFYVSTRDGTATSAQDYFPLTNFPVTIRVGESARSFSVSTKPNDLTEIDESFDLFISSSTISSGSSAAVTLKIPGRNTPPPPPPPPPLPTSITISDAVVVEGNSGLTAVSFTVSLSASSRQSVTLTYASQDGSATTADNDYVSQSGSLTFLPGETTKTVTIGVVGDTTAESDEAFSVVLANPVNAVISRSRGFATIRNDDAPPAIDAWTIFVYMTGDDLNNFAYQDINEMERALAKLPATVNIVVSWDQWTGLDGKGRPVAAYSTGNGAQAAWRTYGRAVLSPDTVMPVITSNFEVFSVDRNTGDPATLVDFVRWGVQQAPAQNYALMMWGHGEGLMGSNADREAGNDQLLGPELKAALASAGMPAFKIVGFDSCLMGMVEVGHAVAPSMAADGVFVASQELEDGEGHDYTTLFDVLVGNPYAVSAEAFARGIVRSYQNAPHSFQNDTYSASRASSFPALATSIRSFVSAVSSASSDIAVWSSLRTAASQVPTYGEKTFADLGSYMQRIVAWPGLNQGIKSAASSVLTSLRNTVIDKTNDVRSSSGLSIYLRADGFYDPRYQGDAPDFISVTGWDRFVLWLSTGAASQASLAAGSPPTPSGRPVSRASTGSPVSRDKEQSPVNTAKAFISFESVGRGNGRAGSGARRDAVVSLIFSRLASLREASWHSQITSHQVSG
jgi:hypothetical protein